MKRKNLKKLPIFLILISIVLVISGAILFVIMAESNNITKFAIVESVEERLKIINEMHDENKHVIGWIEIKNSNVNYPVLYSGDDYYLRRNYKGNYQREGSIYIDKHNNLSDINLIIHGHNIDNGTMFRDLLKYKEEDFYKEHKIINFCDLNECKEYEIISVFLSKVYMKTETDVFKYYKFYGDQSEEEYKEYVKNVKELSLYDIETTAKYPDKLITLSTCEFSVANGRLVVVAKEL